jgi:DNA polymerase III delta subunit
MSGKEILDRLSTQDLFSSKRLFILRDPHKLKGKANLELIDICLNPIDNHTLVLILDDWTSSKIIKKIEKIISPIDTQTPMDNEVVKWVKYLFKINGKVINHDVIRHLVKNSGDSLSHISNEIEKICICLGDRDLVNLEDVVMFSGWEREHKRWEFLKSLGNRNYVESMKTGKILINNQETMISLLYPLTYMFQEFIYEKINTDTFTINREYIPIPPSIKKNIGTFSKNFSFDELESILSYLNYIDLKQKTTLCIDETDLVQFIFHVTKR